MSEHLSNLAIGQRFTRERKRLQLTQAELSQKIGVSKVMVSRYACGHSPPSAVVLVKMDQLGADIRYILTGKSAETPQTPPPLRPDLDRLSQALAEATRQTVVNGEVISQRGLLDRAWAIYQAWEMLTEGDRSDLSSQGI